MLFLSGMPKEAWSALRKAVASGLALSLAACQLQMPGTISKPGGKLATDQAAQQPAPVGPAANGTSRFGSATTPSSAKLDYNSTVVSKGPFGPSINPHSDTTKKYFLQQEAECPLPLPAPSASTSTTYVNGTTCQTTEKWRYYYKVIDGGLDANGNQVLGYYLMVHEDITSVCEDGISSSTSSPEDTHPDVQTYICVNAPSPSPSPSPTDPPTPTPAPPSPTPPAPTATPVPPPTPPPPPPTPSPPPSCDVSTDLKVGLQVVHAGFSPDGDGKEETADIDVTTCNNWNLTVKGPGLDTEKTLATGKGNGGIKAWNGRLPDGTQLNGQYTVTLKTDGGGPDHAVTVDITAYRFDQPTPNAFSPNNDTIKDTIPLMVHAASGSGWTITTDDPKHPGTRLTLKTGSGATSDKDAAWNGTAQSSGVILKDGNYTLRLTPHGLNSAVTDPSVEVVIDTAKPKISTATLLEVDQVDENFETESEISNQKVNYKISVEATDQTGGAATSNINLDSIKPVNSNIKYESFEKSTSPENKAILDVKFLSKNTGDLILELQISDQAGNASAPFSFTLNHVKEKDAYQQAGLMSVDDTVGENQLATSVLDSQIASATGSTPSAYRLQANASGIIDLLVNIIGKFTGNNRQPVFYEKSGLTCEYRIYVLEKTYPGSRIPMTGRAFFIHEASNTVAKSYKFSFTSNTLLTKILTWNGRDNRNRLAPKGKYRVLLQATGPGIPLDENVLAGFKVSDRKCLSLATWQGFRPAAQDLQEAAHVLHGHVVDPGKRNKPEELFGTFDPSLKIPAQPGYSENGDKRIGFTQTRAIVLSHAGIYSSIMKLGAAVWDNKDSVFDVPTDPFGKYIPVVLSSKAVLWTRAIQLPNKYIIPGSTPIILNLYDTVFSTTTPTTINTIYDVYPYRKAQDQYEDKL